MTTIRSVLAWATDESRARAAYAAAAWVHPAAVGRCARCPTLIIRYGKWAHGTLCPDCRAGR